jgi:hypothetical protein
MSGADAKCQALADAQLLGGIFRAWVSPSVAATGMAVVDRFTHSTIPYVRMDGRAIASSWTALVTSGPLNPIVVTESGADLSSSAPLVWSGTLSDGTAGGGVQDQHCAEWTSGTAIPTGEVGNATKSGSDGAWTGGAGNNTCNQPAHLYCFEQ